YMGAGGDSPHAALLLALSTFLAQAGLFAHNDLTNIEEDKINRPDAPLVAGTVGVHTAKAVAYSSLGAGGLLAALLGPAPLAIYLTAATAGVLYNTRLKKVPLAGNLTVAFLTSMTYIYGMAAAKTASPILTLLFTSTLVANLGRELVKVAIDHEGDLKAGIKTAAVLLGPQKAARLGAYVTLASLAPGLALAYLSYVERLYALAAGVLATSAMLAYLSTKALGGAWTQYKNGTLLAFATTLVALVAEAIWLQY
ncbi:MAG: UbiA family prenyltransferase, partial [Pyrobaculum sp.]